MVDEQIQANIEWAGDSVDILEDQINELADKMIEEQSFQYKTFKEAQTSVEVGGFKCDFDRLSLGIYSHNIPRELFSKLCKRLQNHYFTRDMRETQKAISEYAVLREFIQFAPEYSTMNISKEVRPDFILRDETHGIAIGIEVTQLTTENDAILTDIVRKNLGEGLSAEEIHRNAVNKHKDKAEKFKYHDLGDRVGIESGVFDCEENCSSYAEEIIKKCGLYKKERKDYDHFIILCDAISTFCVINQADTDDIMDVVKEKAPDACGYDVVILYADSWNKLVMSRYFL